MSSISKGIERSIEEPVKQGKPEDNFTVADIHELEKIKDFATLKARAKALIKGKPIRRMKPEKIAYFYDRVDTLTSPMKVIKMMYDLLLAGEGLKTIGSWNSMDPNSYAKRFAEDQNTGSVIYSFDQEDPLNKSEILILGGAGRYTFEGLRKKARKEAAALAQDLEIDSPYAFERSAYNIKQLANTLNTIKKAYAEMEQIKKRGGVKSRGLKDLEEENLKEISDFKRKEIEFELRHEKNNYAVSINGKVWKVFADEKQANNIARSLRNKGKDAKVYPTGAEVSESEESKPRSAKALIYQTDMYGAKGYFAECAEPGCDWKSKSYDRITQAQASAKKHGQEHFKNMKEGYRAGAVGGAGLGIEKSPIEKVLEKPFKCSPVDEHINTPGGMGQAYRKFTPKTSKAEDLEEEQAPMFTPEDEQLDELKHDTIDSYISRQSALARGGIKEPAKKFGKVTVPAWKVAAAKVAKPGSEMERYAKVKATHEDEEKMVNANDPKSDGWRRTESAIMKGLQRESSKGK